MENGTPTNGDPKEIKEDYSKAVENKKIGTEFLTDIEKARYPWNPDPNYLPEVLKNYDQVRISVANQKLNWGSGF